MKSRLAIKNLNANASVEADVVTMVVRVIDSVHRPEFSNGQLSPKLYDVDGLSVTDAVDFDTYVKWSLAESHGLTYSLTHLLDDPSAPVHAHTELYNDRLSGQFGIYTDVSNMTRAFYQLLTTPQINPTDDFVLDMTLSLNTTGGYTSTSGSYADMAFWIADEGDVQTSFNNLDNRNKYYVGVSSSTTAGRYSSDTDITVGLLYDNSNTMYDSYENPGNKTWDITIEKSGDTFDITVGSTSLTVTRTYTDWLRFYVMVMEMGGAENQYVDFQIDITRFELT